MKKSILLLLPLFFAACEHETITTGFNYNITLDGENTYYAGEPVRFNIEGDVDNIIFYSGEFGHEYQYKDRYNLPTEDVASAVFELEIQHRWGNAEPALEIYMSNSFDGLSGTDGLLDREVVRQMYEAGMPGWEKVEFDDQLKQDLWVPLTLDLKEKGYLDQFSIAFHWNPPKGGVDENGKIIPTRFDTYWLRGDLSIAFYDKNFPATDMTLNSLIDVTVMMSDELDPYYVNEGNGSIRTNTSGQDLNFAGGQLYNPESPNDNHIKHYDCEGWVFTAPQSINKVENDKAVVIKNMQNDLDYYEYTWTEPGAYEVVFVGTTKDYLESDQSVKKFTINILDTPVI